MVIRLDVRHWLHRWDSIVIKQTHAKYGLFISALAGAVLAYNKQDLDSLIEGVRQSNRALYGGYSNSQMMTFLKPSQLKQYVRRISRGIEVRQQIFTVYIDIALFNQQYKYMYM